MSRVSVIIAAYDPGPLLYETLASLQQQSVTDWSAIVVDDHSSQDLQWVAELDQRISYLRLDRNEGPSVARNLGIARSDSELICFLDQDDLWAPQKLESQLASLRPNVSLAHTGFDLIDVNGDLIGDGYASEGSYRAMLSGRLGVLLSSAMVPREALDKVGGFNPLLRMQQDLDLFLRLSMRGDVAFEPDVLVHYRRHPGQASKNYWRTFGEIERVFGMHQLELGQLPPGGNEVHIDGMSGIRRTYALQALDEARAARSRRDRGATVNHLKRMAAIDPRAAAVSLLGPIRKRWRR